MAGVIAQAALPMMVMLVVVWLETQTPSSGSPRGWTGSPPSAKPGSVSDDGYGHLTAQEAAERPRPNSSSHTDRSLMPTESLQS